METFKSYIKHALLCIVVACMFAGCEEEENKGAPELVGKWTSVSATGTLEYAYGNAQLAEDLTKTVNAKMETYNLKNVVLLEFDIKGRLVVTSAEPGITYFNEFNYRLEDIRAPKDNLYMFADNLWLADNVPISLNGDRFTTGVSNSEFDIIVACALGDRELKRMGLTNMQDNNIKVITLRMNITFEKVK